MFAINQECFAVVDYFCHDSEICIQVVSSSVSQFRVAFKYFMFWCQNVAVKSFNIDVDNVEQN